MDSTTERDELRAQLDGLLKHQPKVRSMDGSIVIGQQINAVRAKLATLETATVTRYRMLFRPLGYATYPDGVITEWVELPHDLAGREHLFPGVPMSSYRYGVFTTDRPFTAEEMASYQIAIERPNWLDGSPVGGPLRVRRGGTVEEVTFYDSTIDAVDAAQDIEDGGIDAFIDELQHVEGAGWSWVNIWKSEQKPDHGASEIQQGDLFA